MKPTVFALGCVLALGLGGCGGSDKPKVTAPTAPPTAVPAAVGTIQGRLLMGGGPDSGTSIAVPGRLTIKGNGSTLHADIGKDGRFAIQLAPGSYQITATSPSYLKSKGTCSHGAAAVLAAAKSVTANVYCQMR